MDKIDSMEIDYVVEEHTGDDGPWWLLHVLVTFKQRGAWNSETMALERHASEDEAEERAQVIMDDLGDKIMALAQRGERYGD